MNLTPRYLVFPVVAAFSLLAVASGRANLLVYDGFDYAAGEALATGDPFANPSTATGLNGGTGFGSTYRTTYNGSANGASIVSGSLGDPTMMLATTGNSTRVATNLRSGQNTGFFREIQRDFNPGITLGTTGTTRFVSILLRPEELPGATGLNTSYFGLYFGNQGSPRVFIGSNDGTLFNLSNYGGSGVTASSAVAPGAGALTLLVLRADFQDGNDVLSLYVNPIPGQPLPAMADAVKTDLDLGTNVNGLGFATTTTIGYDEFRLGETFADVTPVPEPATWLAGIASVGAVGWSLRRRRRGNRRGADAAGHPGLA